MLLPSVASFGIKVMHKLNAFSKAKIMQLWDDNNFVKQKCKNMRTNIKMHKY